MSTINIARKKKYASFRCEQIGHSWRTIRSDYMYVMQWWLNASVNETDNKLRKRDKMVFLSKKNKQQTTTTTETHQHRPIHRCHANLIIWVGLYPRTINGKNGLWDVKIKSTACARAYTQHIRATETTKTKVWIDEKKGKRQAKLMRGEREQHNTPK